MWYTRGMENETGYRESFTLRVGDRGRVVLPAALRERLGLREGDRLVIAVEGDGTVRLVAGGEAARKGRGVLDEVLPGREAGKGLADDLVVRRRTEGSSQSGPGTGPGTGPEAGRRG